MLIMESDLALLRERLRRLFTHRDGALAVFAPDGMLIYANAAALAWLAGATTLSTFGIETLAATALETGNARGTGRLGGTAVDVTAERLDVEKERVLVVTLTRLGEAPRAQTAPQVTDRPRAEPIPEPLVAAPAAPVMASAPVAPIAPTAAVTPAAEPAPVVPPASVTPAAEPAPASAAAQHEPAAERRHPLRFVWHMDADGRFGVGSDEFIELVGPHTTAAFGRQWNEIAAELKLDPRNEVARAVSSRETWSGVVVSWPVDDSSERLPVEMSGLPVFDRDRSFRGYRGFGVCRDIDRINQLARARRERPMGFMPAPAPEPAPQAAQAAAAEKEETDLTAEAAPQSDRPAVNVAPISANVVPFRPSPPVEPKVPPAEGKPPPTLSPVERRAFRELAQELTTRLREPQKEPAADGGAGELPAKASEAPAAAALPAAEAVIEQVLLDRIPIGVLVYRHDSLLYANRHFLEWSGYESLAAIAAAGGLNTLFAEPGADTLAATGGGQLQSITSLSIMTQRGDKLPVEGRMFTVPWNGSSALALILTNGQTEAVQHDAERALGAAETENRELKSILDAATDGVITLDGEGRIVGANARAAALFGKSADEMPGRPFGDLLAPESERAARDYFDRIARGTGTLHNVLDVAARVGDDRLVALAMTLARVGTDHICAVFRDATARKQTEEELRNAKREALRAASAKAEFLAKVSHEIRTPLNAMTGFAEVIMAERFGPIGNERYREYVKDIHGAGTHLVALLNDLLDLSRIETGQIDLAFANVNLNELTRQCVGIMQPQANRARIIIRTSLTPGVPLVVADERSLRQIVINLLSNSIRLTGPGGQVIVSTVFSDSREAVLRVRDTGAGMSEKDIAAALEPFRQIATSGSWGSGGTGFGLPLTKALAEANRANFSIKSAPNAGTLVEIAFPPSRIVAG